jgi:hypothetical protein
MLAAMGQAEEANPRSRDDTDKDGRKERPAFRDLSLR